VYFEHIIPLAEITNVSISNGAIQQKKTNVREDEEITYQPKAVYLIRVFKQQ